MPALKTLQAHAVRRLGVAGLAYLVATAVVLGLVLRQRGIVLAPWQMAVLALPATILLGVLLHPASAPRQAVLHVLVATLFPTLLVLFWAASLEPDTIAPSSTTLDVQRLFAGANGVQDTPLGGGIHLMRSGRFDDGSELRLMRFADAPAAAAYVAMLARSLQGEPWAEGGRRALRLHGSGATTALVLIEQHGADLIELRARDSASALVRLNAQHIVLPAVLPASSDEPAAAIWPALLVGGLVHAGVFVAMIAVGAATTTCVPASPGVAPASTERLRARLRSLLAPDSTFAHALLAIDTPQQLVIELPNGAQRSHRITLQFDIAQPRVQVREQLGANGAAPQNSDEASMRSLGDSAFDLSRPQALRVWSTTRQATVIEPERVESLPLQLQGDMAMLPAPKTTPTPIDGEAMLTALCAMVTRSGWSWRPTL